MKNPIVRLMAVMAVAASFFEAKAIEIGEEENVVIYCVSSLEGNRGVYTLPVSGDFDATKISGTTYIQYDFGGSGGTFTDANTVYGSRSTGMSVYAGKATAEGGGDGPWSHTAWTWRSKPPYVDFTYDIVATDMTFDPVSKQIFGWFKADSYGLEYRLCVYDGENCKTTPVGPATSLVITAIAADRQGQLWGIAGRQGHLYRIDKTDGSVTDAGALPVTATGENQSATFDPTSGKLYWNAVLNSMDAALYRVDVNALSAEKVYDFPMGKRFSAFSIPVKEANAGAPAAVADLAGRFTGSGSDVEVTFSAPVKTFGGGNLSGNVRFKLSTDGSELDAGTIKSGDAYAKTFTLTEGVHSLSVIMSNGQGAGPAANAEVLVGFDEPGRVTGLTATASGSTVTLVWNAPVGLNGGVVDLDKVTYTVTRIPEGAAVAEGLKVCAFTDVIPEGPIAEYTYSVTVCCGSETGLTTISDPVLVGEPNTVPYSQDFNSLSTLSEVAYKVINDRADTNTWELVKGDDGNGYVSVKGKYPFNRDDYLFTAPLALEAGIEYTLDFKVANSSSSEPAQLSVFLSRAQSASEDAFVKPYLIPELTFTATEGEEGEFVGWSVKFTVGESGAYCLGFHDFGAYYSNNAVSIDDIRLKSDKSSLGSAAVATVSAAVSANTLRLIGAEGLPVTVFTPVGAMVARVAAAPADWAVTLPAGFYVVSAGNSSFKVQIP